MIITDLDQLKRPCKNISLFEAQEVISKLENELYNSPVKGIGLASNQIGLQVAVCIIRINQTKIDLVNPIITQQYDLSEFEGEGCLSFPGEHLLTKRYAEVVVQDSLHPIGLVLVGIEAVVAQHEISHLNGETMHQYQIVRPTVNQKCWCEKSKYKKCHMNKIIR
jgi:peptide deformylase